ncbi:hypothetical protein [Shinella zoogloeoides]|uniref:hypothetical protein n=1 Tax=Shinella zoogloeoides TaxID=352475 RepID=UPI00273D568E|nr:hypothetical protein [Shinella zoogloeoides]WLR92991.1 hypothetical protein Q9316_01915 [Shinella zoogloeoides]
MTNPTRRSFLAFVGTGLVASSAEAGDSIVLSGTVTNVASGPVPVGRLMIRLEEQGIMDVAAERIAETTVVSKGNRHSIRFSMRVKRSALRKAIDPGFTIRLERDGRLIATNTTKQGYSGRGKVSLQIEPILY